MRIREAYQILLKHCHEKAKVSSIGSKGKTLPVKAGKGGKKKKMLPIIMTLCALLSIVLGLVFKDNIENLFSGSDTNKEKEETDEEESHIQSETYYLGEEIYKTNCRSCHNLPGGGMLVGPDLKDILTHDRFVNEEDPIATFIKYTQNPKEFGIIMMPPQDLNDDEVLSVLEFINTYISPQ